MKGEPSWWRFSAESSRIRSCWDFPRDCKKVLGYWQLPRQEKYGGWVCTHKMVLSNTLKRLKEKTWGRNSPIWWRLIPMFSPYSPSPGKKKIWRELGVSWVVKVNTTSTSVGYLRVDRYSNLPHLGWQEGKSQLLAGLLMLRTILSTDWHTRGRAWNRFRG